MGKIAISTNTEPTWKVVDENGDTIETFRVKQTARERIKFLRKIHLRELKIVHISVTKEELQKFK